MRTRIWIALAALGTALCIAGLTETRAPGQGAQFPQTLSANTVLGRLGAGAGPVQAIPFGTLFANLSGAGLAWNDASTIIGDTTKFWTGGANTAVVQRFNRLLCGEAALGGSGTPPSPLDWLESDFTATTQNSQFACVNSIGTIAVTGASRTSDAFGWAGAGTIGTIGAYFAGLNDSTHNASSWGLVVQGTRTNAAGIGATYGAEIDLANYGAALTTQDPYNMTPSGYAYGLLIAAGGNALNGAGALANSPAAMAINTAATAKFSKGIIFGLNGLDGAQGQGGGGIALEMATGQSFRWLSAANTNQVETWGNAAGFNIKGPLVALNLITTNVTNYSQVVFTGTGRVFQVGVGNASEVTLGVANQWFLYDASAAAVRLSLDSTGVFKFGAPSFVANGSVATAMSSVGPAGSHTTVQEWFTVQDSAGTVRYIPAF